MIMPASSINASAWFIMNSKVSVQLKMTTG